MTNIFENARQAPQIARGSKVGVKCQGCRKPFLARSVDVKRGWGKFCSKSCKAIKQEQRTGQYAHFLNGKYSEEGSNRWTDDDGNKYARCWDRFGQRSMVSRTDAMTGEVDIEVFDKHGLSEGFIMSSEQLAGGGYGDATWDSPFGDGKD